MCRCLFPIPNRGSEAKGDLLLSDMQPSQSLQALQLHDCLHHLKAATVNTFKGKAGQGRTICSPEQSLPVSTPSPACAASPALHKLDCSSEVAKSCHL